MEAPHDPHDVSGAWERVSKDFIRLSSSLSVFSAVPDATSQLRAGLANPSERRATLLILGLLGTRQLVPVADLVVEASESHRDARLARELLGRLPHDELEKLIPGLVRARLEQADDDAYRRLAELLVHLGLPDALAELCTVAAASENPAIREVAADFGA